MKTQITMEQKLADWELAFNSISNMQNDQYLKGLIESIRVKMGIVTTGMA